MKRWSKCTYLGVPAETHVVGSRGDGNRVALVRWLAPPTVENGGPNVRAGDVVATHCKGDGRIRAEFECFAKVNLGPVSNDEAITWGRAALKGVYK